MSRVPRFIGYAFMVVAALLLAAVMKKHGVESVGPCPRSRSRCSWA